MAKAWGMLKAANSDGFDVNQYKQVGGAQNLNDEHVRKVVNMINRGFAIRKNVVGFLVVAGWLIGSQPASAQESGKQTFQKSCAACHSIGGGKLVGPDLAGVNDKRPEDWLLKYIRSSQTLVKSGDKVAAALFEEFNKIPMPDQALSDEQIKKVLAHIKEAGGSPAAGKEAAAPSAQAVKKSAPVATPD